MSYTRQVGDITIHVACESNPEEFYETHKDEIIADMKAIGFEPETSYDNIVKNAVLFFDCDDNFGEYDQETGAGGYERTIDDFFSYVDDSNGYNEFDYYT